MIRVHQILTAQKIKKFKKYMNPNNQILGSKLKHFYIKNLYKNPLNLTPQTPEINIKIWEPNKKKTINFSWSK